MSDGAVEIAKRCYQAYIDKDRAAIEALIADDFTFTSPLDNAIDRAKYFELCWPNSKTAEAFDYKHVVQDGERVFVTYEGTHTGGKRFRNTEVLTIRDGKLRAVEVYFGWNLPHKAKPGEHVDPE